MLREQRPIPLTIHIDKLVLDPKNPRLPARFRGADQISLLQWMLEDASIFELMYSIGQQDYFDGEPLLVAETVASKEYLVVEGNRRLAALKLLQNPNLVNVRQKTLSTIIDDADFKPTEVPCIVYSNREEILDHLGFRHVTGVKSWGPLAKARYLNDLSAKYAEESETRKYRLLAKSIGSRTDYVKRMLTGLRLYDVIEEEDYYDIDNLNESTISFSLLTTALANSNIVTFLGLQNAQDLKQENLQHKHLEELTRWIFERDEYGHTKLGESRHLKDLNRVVANDIALKQFRSGRTLDEALIYTDGPVTTFRSLLKKAKSNLEQSRNQLYLIRDGLTTNDKMILTDINRIARDVRITLEGRLDEARHPDNRYEDD